MNNGRTFLAKLWLWDVRHVLIVLHSTRRFDNFAIIGIRGKRDEGVYRLIIFLDFFAYVAYLRSGCTFYNSVICKKKRK